MVLTIKKRKTAMYGSTLMFIGSSMTQRAFELENLGFGIDLANWYTRFIDIIIRGHSGYNSRWTLLGLKEMIGQYKPTIVCIFLGNNDSSTGGQYVPLDEYKSNIQAIIEYIKSVNPDVTLILITPTRSDIPQRTDERSKEYADVIRQIVNETSNSAVLDTWIDKYSITVDDLCDGLHLNASGNKKISEGIKNVIRTNFPQFIPYNDSSHSACDDNNNNALYNLPTWDELSGSSLEESIAIFKKYSEKNHSDF
jgi:lysophospholipase L1-like esterase